MAAFLSRTVDGVLKRGSRRTALRQFWDVQNAQNLLLTVTLGAAPSMVEFDGADLWVSLLGGKVGRVRASDGKLLETWTGVNDKPNGIALAMGKVIIATAGQSNGLTGRLMQIDPGEVAGAATTVATNLPQFAFGLAFDGGRFWTTNLDGTVSIVTPGATVPWTVTTTAGVFGVCGPFTDVSDAAFCPFVLEIFTLGITTGTTPTTYDPGNSVTRLQMAGFLSRTVDGVLQRGNRRAVVKKFWMPQNAQVLGLTSLGTIPPSAVQSDGKDLWVSSVASGMVARVRASDGRLLETWKGPGRATRGSRAGTGIAPGRRSGRRHSGRRG